MKRPVFKILFASFFTLFLMGLFVFWWSPEKKEIHQGSNLNDHISYDDEDKKEFISSLEEALSSTKDENLLLIQMTLTLIKNYYVDSGSFSFEKLYLSSLESMKNQGLLNFKIYDTYIEIYNGNLNSRILKSWLNDDLGKIVSILKISKVIDAKNLNSRNEDVVVQTLGMIVSVLDPYSRLLSEDDYKELKEGTEGEFGGLGIVVGMRNNLLTVMKILPHSPAYRSGIRPLDTILSINGHVTFGNSLEDLVKVMRGSPGSPVKVTYLRNSFEKPLEVVLNRELLQIDPLSAKYLKTIKNNDVLLLKLDTFSLKSYERMRDEIEKGLFSNKIKLQGIIIDLRDNPGGLLEQSIKIAKMFLPEGDIVTINGRESETEKATHENLNIKCPIIVLLNEDSASASEILAGALKDHGKALIIGQPSYGKGTVQSLFDLPHGRALKLTIARYLTPSGNSIQGIGVMPDIWLHPLLKQYANMNMLGDYRYQSDGEFIGFHAKKNKLLDAYLEGYYLRDDYTDVQSKEIQLALDLFDFLKDEAGMQQPVVQKENLKNQLKNKIQKWESEVFSYLKNIKINWMGADKHRKYEFLSLNDVTIETTGPINIGQEIAISFSVKNDSNFPASRVSVFLRSVYREMNSVEKLIGVIDPKSIAYEHLKMVVPIYWLSGRTDLEIGLAVDGVAIEESQQRLFFDIMDNKEPKLSLTYSLKTPIRARAVSELTIQIRNEGENSLEIDSVDVSNLSGKQVSIKKLYQNQSTEIPAHDIGTYLMEIKGGEEILTSSLDFGISVESHSLKKTYQKIIHLNSVDSRESTFSKK